MLIDNYIVEAIRKRPDEVQFSGTFPSSLLISNGEEMFTLLCEILLSSRRLHTKKPFYKLKYYQVVIQ